MSASAKRKRLILLYPALVAGVLSLLLIPSHRASGTDRVSTATTAHRADLASDGLADLRLFKPPRPTTTVPAPTTTVAPTTVPAPATTATTAPRRAAVPAAPRAAPVAAGSLAGYPVVPQSSFERCVLRAETSGRAPEEVNSSGHWGLYQFSRSTWLAYATPVFGAATAAALWENASPAQQQQVFEAAMARGGESNWAPYDGC